MESVSVPDVIEPDVDACQDIDEAAQSFGQEDDITVLTLAIATNQSADKRNPTHCLDV